MKVTLGTLLMKNGAQTEMAFCKAAFNTELSLNELIVACQVKRRENGEMQSVVYTEESVFCP